MMEKEYTETIVKMSQYTQVTVQVVDCNGTQCK